MPLRDHFHSPVDDHYNWEWFYGGWPAMIVQVLSRQLPQRYCAGPRVHLGKSAASDAPSEVAYEVRVFDAERGRRIVAAVEIVSPLNKDRSENRRAFVSKCAALLRERASVTIVDLVTTSRFNLYRELLDVMGQADPHLGPEPPPLYAVACRGTKKGDTWLLETWAQALALGQPLPTLPLWLADNLAVPLELEGSYEETCRVLRIP